MARSILTKQYRKSKLARLIVPVVSCSFLAYFAFHAQSGHYGLESKRELMQSLAAAAERYDKLRDQRERLEKRVELLHDGTLDRDMIDERARQALNYSTPDEVMIMR
ncbi:cell division protein [Aureimonas endophytica]|uniref:Cell division protein n=1 Tax=Aureimonas endophytica TaxID=2027858 RepID=A0A916ZD49_9HYPH|nr:septum formation initiator family protein [Aureimonas endophytica]GGD89251.1 cell division protein [Aureimonas endophytica]